MRSLFRKRYNYIKSSDTETTRPIVPDRIHHYHRRRESPLASIITKQSTLFQPTHQEGSDEDHCDDDSSDSDNEEGIVSAQMALSQHHELFSECSHLKRQQSALLPSEQSFHSPRHSSSLPTKNIKTLNASLGSLRVANMKHPSKGKFVESISCSDAQISKRRSSTRTASTLDSNDSSEWSRFPDETTIDSSPFRKAVHPSLSSDSACSLTTSSLSSVSCCDSFIASFNELNFDSGILTEIRTHKRQSKQEGRSYSKVRRINNRSSPSSRIAEF